MAKKAEKIHPPRRLADKVRKSGGPAPDKAILRALNAAEDLIDSYQGWAIDDLTALWRAFNDASPKGESAKQIERMFEIAHGIRGEGGSFNFPLISIIGDSLCKFIEGRQRLRAADKEVVKVHILAMRAVFHQNLQGEQPGLEGELRQLLTLLRDRMS